MVKAIAGWLVRHAILFVALAAAIAFFQFGGADALRQAVGGTIAQEWRSPAALERELTRARGEVQQAFRTAPDRFAALGKAQRAQALAARRADLARVRRALAARDGFFGALRPSVILTRKRNQLRAIVLEREIALLEAAGPLARARGFSIPMPAQAAIDAAQARCAAANRALAAFRQRSTIERIARNLVQQAERGLVERQNTACGAYVRQRDARIAAQLRMARMQAEYDAQRRRYAALTRDGQAALTRYSPDVTQRTVRDIAMKALIALLLVIVMPYLIRLLCWFVLAPLAERRAPIRISATGPGTVSAPPIPPAPPSRVSVAVRLDAGEELLVRQDHVQTTSLAGAKRTRWLLDWRHPMSSLAAGLAFLTAIRGEGETTTVSASRDPFAELTVLTLPEGASCVLHARALVAAVQPVDRVLRIRSHWRLLQPSAWLTLQLRYLVFTGPARLVVKGGRGVSVEPVTRGRVFGQDQLTGFSADLAYSVTRTETFWPYFLGRETLLKDKVVGGTGVLIVEEAPLSARRGGGGVRHGLEGGLDAAMKAFGM